MIIFVHIPKTAGTSFRIGLEKAFGRRHLIQDYGPNSPETEESLRQIYRNKPFKPARVAQIASQNKTEVICGHFPASRYMNVFPNATAVAFVREPLQRSYSEYLHFCRHRGYTETFETFFQQKHQLNLQSRFLEMFPDHGIIGCTEHYEASLACICKTTNLSIPQLRLNRNPQKTKDFDLHKKIGANTVSLFYYLNERDVVLFEKVKKQFAAYSVTHYGNMFQTVQTVKARFKLSLTRLFR